MQIDLGGNITAEEAMVVAETIHREVDRAVEARAKAAAEEGVVIACKRGCNYCCEEMLVVFEPEALLVARWLRQPENAAAREAFAEAYPAWRAAVGDAPEELADLVARRDKKGYEAAHVKAWRRRILCAFNRGGDCTIYPVRPANCRNGHAIDTAEHCRGDTKRAATRLQFVPLDRFLQQARDLDQTAHKAVGGTPGRPQALCVAVHRLLEAQP